MSWKLRTFVYSGPRGIWEELTDRVSNLRISAVIHGGIQAIDFVMADDYVGAYRWAYNYNGCKVYVFDNHLVQPVAEGVILDASITGCGNQVVATGPWLAYMFNQVYNDTASWITAGQTGAQIKHILAADCPGISTDQTNVGEPGTNNFPWQPSDNSYPGDLVEFLASLSDASFNEWYFWLATAGMNGSMPNAPIPHFTYSDDIELLYQTRREDMTPTGLTLTASLRELANDVRVMYQDATGIQNQTASALDADSQARYGVRERWDYDLGKAPAAAANQYRSMLLARYKDPQQSAAFQVNSRIYNRWGRECPLWRIIADFPCKFAVVDLVPDSPLPDYPLDEKRTFMTLAAEYDYDSNTLRIVPDTEDNRADAMLARHRGLQ